MIWADRIALRVSLFIIVCAAGLYGVLMVGTRMAGASTILPYVLEYCGIAIAATALPLWLVLRLIDVFSGGPARRARKVAAPSARTEPRSLRSDLA